MDFNQSFFIVVPLGLLPITLQIIGFLLLCTMFNFRAYYLGRNPNINPKEPHMKQLKQFITYVVTFLKEVRTAYFNRHSNRLLGS